MNDPTGNGPDSPAGVPAGAAVIHPIVRAAGEFGELPDWARLDRRRREHSERVVALLEGWALALDLPEPDRVRWRAAGHLHDALKSAEPIELRRSVPSEEIWPDSLLHGPACAALLREGGVRDEPLLAAIAHHSTGHPDFDSLGEFLYLADYLEPGRKHESAQRSALAARLPHERRPVIRDVAARRIAHLLEKRLPILSTTIEFWNGLVRDADLSI